MRVSAGQPYDTHTSRTATAQRALPDQRERIRGIGITTVWLDALAVFVLHAPAILFVACVCIAGPAMLGLLINIALGLATWEAIITLQHKGSIAVIVVLVVQVGLGAIGLAFARGVIARLTLSDSDEQDAPSLRLACRETTARFPSLLVGSLLYGACVTVGAVGINAALRDTGLDLRYVGRHDVTTPAQDLALRTLDAFVPSPGSPFAEFVPLLRHSSFADTPRFASTARSSTDYRHWSFMSHPVQVAAENPAILVAGSDALVFAISLASLGVLLLAEALLRFTPIMAMRMRACGRTRLGAITPVLRSVGFGIRHFGAITTHVWLLRLAFVAGYGVFFLLPVVLSQDVAPPIVTSVTKSVLGQWSVTLMLVCHSLVTALFVAFSTVYDARLVMQLDAHIAGH